MTKLLISLAFTLCIFGGCENSNRDKVTYPATIDIDSSKYFTLVKQFKLREVSKAPAYLGGLRPNFPIAIAYQDCFTTRDTDWTGGGRMCSNRKIIIKEKDRYLLINTHKELAGIFAPITSREAALSYAILYTRFFAVLDDSFFKFRYKYYGGKPNITDVKAGKNDYLINLFYYQVFGCEHPYYSIIVKVNKQGTVEILSQKKVFEDPRDKGLCID